MKIYRKETSLDISELNLNDYYLILGMIDAIHKLVSDNELSSFIELQRIDYDRQSCACRLVH